MWLRLRAWVCVYCCLDCWFDRWIVAFCDFGFGVVGVLWLFWVLSVCYFAECVCFMMVFRLQVFCVWVECWWVGFCLLLGYGGCLVVDCCWLNTGCCVCFEFVVLVLGVELGVLLYYSLLWGLFAWFYCYCVGEFGFALVGEF